MVAEVRHIIFRPIEAVAALKEFSRRSGTPFLAAAIEQFAPEQNGAEGPIRLRIVFTPKQEMTFDSPVIAAALILYCRDNRIPLPTKADKSVELYGGQLSLAVRMGTKR